MASEKFCLRWNDFESNISGAFRELREDKDFFDVTLACDDEQLQAHKVILSACSPFFRTVLRRNRHEHPLLYLKGVKYADLVSVLNFMYHGEVNVAQEELNSFLAVAEDLKVKGLTQGNNSESKQSSHAPTPRPPDPPKSRLPDPTPPPIKRPRPSPAPTHAPARPSQPAYAADDDDIQEVAPIVKSEPAAAEPAYQPAHQGVVADPNMEGYGEEYGDYEGYEEGDYEGAMMDPNMSGADGNKGSIGECDEGDSTCPECRQTFKNYGSLVHHMKVHMGETTCKICGKVQSRVAHLRRHLANVHGVDMELKQIVQSRSPKKTSSQRSWS